MALDFVDRIDYKEVVLELAVRNANLIFVLFDKQPAKCVDYFENYSEPQLLALLAAEDVELYKLQALAL